MVKPNIPAVTEPVGGVRQPYGDWLEVSLICKNYLDRQKLRIAVESRINKLKFHVLKHSGLIDIIIKDVNLADVDIQEEVEGLEEHPQEKMGESKFDPGNKVRRTIKWKYKDEQAEKDAEKLLNETLYNTEAYMALWDDAIELRKQEVKALKSASRLTSTGLIADWAERTKGLGEVARMTALAFINPKYCTTAGKAKAYMGIRPGASLKKGTQANYNPHAKARFHILVTNLIRCRDPYYKALYDIKKEYYKQRPDLALELQQDEEYKKTHHGHGHGKLAKVERKTRLWLCGMVISHSTELIQRDRGLEIPKHRNHIPPKPEDYAEQMRIVDCVREACAIDIENIKKRIAVEKWTMQEAITWLRKDYFEMYQ